jgi:GT2 family glycosyltransferase
VNQRGLTSVIVVNWNTRELAAQCLRSIFEKNTTVPFETIVVDNGSTDGSADALEREFAGIRLVRNTENLGFAKANNQAMRIARGDVFVLVNSDTVLTSAEPLRRIRSFFDEHPDFGIAGAKLVLPNGRIQSLGRRLPSLGSLIRSQLFFSTAPPFRARDREAVPAVIETECVDGAFLAIRGDVAARIGPMNEGYFMYAEDAEWCLAAGRAGFRIGVLSDVSVLHLHGRSALRDFAPILVHNAVNVSRFVNGTRGSTRAKGAFCVIALGMLLRIPINAVRDPRRAAAYARGFARCCALLPRLGAIVRGKEHVA